MEDIAREVGVSQPTVSRALKNHPHVSEGVRLRVQQAARKLNYRPNSLVSALMASLKGRTPAGAVTTIGFVSTYPTRYGWREVPEYAEFFDGARARAEMQGYQLEHFWTREPGMSAGRLSKVLYTRGVAALLIAPLPRSNGHLTLEWENFTSLALGYSMARPAISRVASDQDQTALLLLRGLRRLGYRRPGLVAERFTGWWADPRKTASSQALRFELPGAMVYGPTSQKGLVESEVLEWFRANRPDVVIAADLCVADWLKKAGHQIPQDVGFAQLSVRDRSKGITGTDQNSRMIGEAAVDMVIGQLNRNERGLPRLPQITLFSSTWVDGTTVQDLRKAKIADNAQLERHTPPIKLVLDHMPPSFPEQRLLACRR